MAAQAVQMLGLGSTDGTLVTSGGSNAKGSWVSLGVAGISAEWFDLLIYSLNSTPRLFFDVGVGASGSQVVLVENLYVYPQSTMVHRNTVPVAIPEGAEVWIRSQGNNSAQPCRVSAALFGRQPGLPAGLSKLVALNPDLTTTVASATSTPLTGAWTELVSSTGRPFRGLGVNIGYSGAAHATAQRGVISIGVGAASSEVVLGQSFAWLLNSAAPVLNSWFFIPADIPAGSRIVGRVNAGTPGSDVLRLDVMGGW